MFPVRSWRWFFIGAAAASLVGLGASSAAATELPITVTTSSVGGTISSGTAVVSQITDALTGATSQVPDPVETVTDAVDQTSGTVNDTVGGLTDSVDDTVGGLIGTIGETLGGLTGNVGDTTDLPAPGGATEPGTEISSRVGSDPSTAGVATTGSDGIGSDSVGAVADGGAPAVVQFGGRSVPEAIVTAAGDFAIPLLMVAALALGLAVAPFRPDRRLAMGPTPNDELLPFE